jgi:acyl-CoA thioester hydrolase
VDGPLMSEFSETTVRVRYAETDQMGVVYHANYYVWFEVGRVEFLRQAGVNYKEMEIKDDCFIVVAESSCRYRKPARYDEVIRVRTRISEGNTRLCRLQYEVLNDETGELLANGETLHVFCGRNGRPKSLPQQYRKFFGVPDPEAAKAER